MGNDAPHKRDCDSAAKAQQFVQHRDAEEAAAAFFELWQASLRAAAKPFPMGTTKPKSKQEPR